MNSTVVVSKANEMKSYIAAKKAQAAQDNKEFMSGIIKKPMKCHYIGVQRDPIDWNARPQYKQGGRSHHDYNAAYANM